MNKRFYKINDNYVYDSITNSLCYGSNLFISRLMNNTFDASELNKREKEFLTQIKKAKDPTIKKKMETDTVYITICYSDNCNLNCTYCYRNKSNNKQKLTISDLEKIIDFIVTKYQPKAKNYIFSLGLTSEPMLDINLLQEFQEYLSKYDGSLLKQDDFLISSPKEIYDQLPSEVKKNVSNNNEYLEQLNMIISTENLTTTYNIKEGDLYEGFNSLLNNRYLCKNKLTFLNRKILEYKFRGVIRENDFHYFNISFFSNGTLITEKKARIIKSFNIEQITISIDGDQEIHNYSRKYNNNQGSYNDVLKGIQNLQKNGITVNASTVLIPEFPYLTRIIMHLRELKINKVKFNILRNENGYLYTKNALENLLNDINRLCDIMIDEFKQNNFSLLNMLDETLLILPIKNIAFRKRFEFRCNWGDNVVIDTKGDLYPCLYTIGKKEFSYGNYNGNINQKTIFNPISVNDKIPCNTCWAKYLCGGSCHFNGFISKNDILDTDEIECLYRKGLIKISLNLISKLIDQNLIGIVINKLKK